MSEQPYPNAPTPPVTPPTAPPATPPAAAPQPEKWTPQKLPTIGAHTATFSLPVALLKKIEAEVMEAKGAGYNRTKSGLVAEALELYFSQK